MRTASGTGTAFLADRDSEAGQERDRAGSGVSGGVQERSELVRGLPTDPAWVCESPKWRAERIEPGGARIDDAVKTLRAQAAEDACSRGRRVRIVVVGEAAVDEVELAREATRQ